jgi:hypothetical protein
MFHVLVQSGLTFMCMAEEVGLHAAARAWVHLWLVCVLVVGCGRGKVGLPCPALPCPALP